MIDALPSLVLGLVQGLTEFLPVSSSGHLALVQQVFGIEEAALSYDLMLHFATMLATFLYFGRDIVSLLREWEAAFFRRTEGIQKDGCWDGLFLPEPE